MLRYWTFISCFRVLSCITSFWYLSSPAMHSLLVTIICYEVINYLVRCTYHLLYNVNNQTRYSSFFCQVMVDSEKWWKVFHLKQLKTEIRGELRWGRWLQSWEQVSSLGFFSVGLFSHLGPILLIYFNFKKYFMVTQNSD